MTNASQPLGRPQEISVPILAIAALCTLVFAVEYGLILTGIVPNADRFAMLYGAFWPQLLHGAQPVFPGQPVAMFASYGFLHGGLLHLAMNMMALLAVGRQLGALMPGRAMLWVYALSQVGGGLGQVLLGDSTIPMVGASGAIFGLVGAEFAIAAIVMRSRGLPLRRLVSPLAQFVGLNLLLMLAVPNIAWQAHLGGAVAGCATGAIWAARRLRARN